MLGVMASIFSIIARFAPFNAVRVAALRALPGVEVGSGVRIGFGCKFKVESLKIGDSVQIGPFNKFVGPVRIDISEKTRIGARNTFGCGDWVSAPRYAEEGYARKLQIGAECLITGEHYFDCAGLISLGYGTWFAGRGSQVWTHGVGVYERDVIIGKGCYLGSAVRVAPGARLGDECILSLGSVLTTDLSAERCAMIAGIPARPIKQLEEDYASGRIEKHGANRR